MHTFVETVSVKNLHLHTYTNKMDSLVKYVSETLNTDKLVGDSNVESVGNYDTAAWSDIPCYFELGHKEFINNLLLLISYVIASPDAIDLVMCGSYDLNGIEVDEELIKMNTIKCSLYTLKLKVEDDKLHFKLIVRGMW